jgi:hypothetical protein
VSGGIGVGAAEPFDVSVGVWPGVGAALFPPVPVPDVPPALSVVTNFEQANINIPQNNAVTKSL